MKTERAGVAELRRRLVERLFAERGWANVDELADWDGEELEALRVLLPDEQFQALLDELEDHGDDER